MSEHMYRPSGVRRGLFLTAAFSALLVLSGCEETTKLAGACTDNADCPAGFTCRDGQCACTEDKVCDQGEFCNANTGFCQARLGCTNSLDCPPGQFCDVAAGNCLDEEYCTSDLNCELGQVCDTVSFKCVNGCRSVGDCPLGDVCICPDGQTCGPNQILTCETGPCGDDSYCRYGERCVEEFPGSPKRCLRDERGPYCEPCNVGPGQSYCAGDTPNFCLVDTSKNYQANYCGVDCSQDENSCPWGFGCSDVLILTEQTCGGGGGMCPVRPSPTCATDADCVDKERGSKCEAGQCRCFSDGDCAGGLCDVNTGQCRSKCVGGEGDVQGFCTCLEHSDCPTDTCDPATSRCRLSQKNCNTADPNSCGRIFCKKVEDSLSKEKIGYCFIGRNCAPVSGVTCDMVRDEQ